MPKISKISEIEKFVLPNYTDFEYQVLGNAENTVSAMNDLLLYFQGSQSTKEITVHFPVSDCAFEFLQFDSRATIEKVINIAFKMAPIRVNILFHVYNSPEKLAHTTTVEYLNKLVKSIQGSNVYILLENVCASISDDCKRDSPAMYLIRMINDPHLEHCFDLCHYQISTRVKRGINTFPVNGAALTRQVHFSSVWNCDGFCDSSTHSRCHKSEESLIIDLKHLEYLGFYLDSTRLVLEIKEATISEYDARPGLLQEIQLFSKAQ